MRNFLLLMGLGSLWLLAACGEDARGRTGASNGGISTDSIEAEPPQYVIRQNRFYRLVPGEPIADAGERLKEGIREDGEGRFRVYHIIGDDGEEIGYVLPSVRDSTLIGDIHVTTPTAATEGDIRVGHTYSRLRIAYPAVEVRGSEIESRAYAYTKNKAFLLRDFTSMEQDVDEAQVPGDTRIGEIIIMDKAPSAPLEI
ncbi:hypothetical protein CLV84_2163 [Neolewinella xylanilytica]|uniref:Lipoprotein n=1 Tax=Neolewinella xylanilytica TaxID=1514080 RepID=A0A2S6I2G3_9BACT|nr:hypothetical protein [Neolewinella xylanilytica]PPK85271.1 hypothetical protein CLV84_2163 [Neolewinella xylanilytica]